MVSEDNVPRQHWIIVCKMTGLDGTEELPDESAATMVRETAKKVCGASFGQRE